MKVTHSVILNHGQIVEALRKHSGLPEADVGIHVGGLPNYHKPLTAKLTWDEEVVRPGIFEATEELKTMVPEVELEQGFSPLFILGFIIVAVCSTLTILGLVLYGMTGTS